MFRPELKQYKRPEGMSLAEIAASIERLPPEFWNGAGVITVGGIAFPREQWHLIRPKVIEGAENVVTLALVPGKGLGSTGLISILASVALIGLTGGIGAGLLAPVLGATFAAGTLGASVAAGVVGLAGSLLLSALFKPPESDNNNARRDKPLAGITGNALAPLAQLPTVRGSIIYTPPHVVPPFTELVRGVLYANAVYGLAGRHEVEDVRLNGSLIDDLDGVEYEIREGDPGDAVLTLVTDTGIESMASAIQMSEFDLDEQNDPLTRLADQGTPANSYPDWHGFTTRGAPDQVWIRLHWPSGMLQTAKSDGETDPGAVPYRMRMRLLGESTWINLPEFHFTDDSKRARRIIQRIYLRWAAGGSTQTVDSQRRAYIAFWNTANGETWEWEADSYFDPGSGIYADHVNTVRDGYDVYLDPEVFPVGTYEIQIIRGLTYDQGNFTPSSYEYSSSTANLFDAFDDGGIWKVQVNQETMTGLCFLEQFTTFRNDYPMATPANLPCPMTFIAVRARNVKLENVSALFTSKVNIWDGADWDTVQGSNNPAALYRDTLKGALNARPLADALIDDAMLQEWYDHCDDKGYTCNAVVADSVPVVLQMIAATGFAVPRQREKWGVIYERDRTGDSIVQQFTPLNSRAQPFERAFPDLPHAIYAEYHDETDEFKVKNTTVYADGYGSSNATKFEAITYPGFTNLTILERRAMFDLRQARSRMTRMPIEIGWEAILSSRGDLVGFTHDVLSNQVGFGVVKAVIAGATVTGLTLEAEANFADVGGAVSMAIRLADGTTIFKAIDETTNSATVTFTTPFTMPVDSDTEDSLVPGCIVAFGPPDQEARRCVIMDMQPAPEFGATLGLVDEAPDLTMVFDWSSTFFTFDDTVHDFSETI